MNLYELNDYETIGTLFDNGDRIVTIGISRDYYIELSKGNGNQIIIDLYKYGGDLNEENRLVETIYNGYTSETPIASLNPYTLGEKCVERRKLW